jgi:pantoate--beta-alanine ligase
MKIYRNIPETRDWCAKVRGAGKRLGLVPTMGALHEGHLSLVRAAKKSCGAVVVSIFVNPTQFGPNEDLGKYPRNFERDCGLLEKEGVDLLFAPGVEEMYPQGAATWVRVQGLSEKLDGRSRPGHFRGVTTVVAKLFHVAEPQAAFFGQKDAAQVAIIRQMVRDLDFPVEIVACPIVREADGLALSSRNVYLDAEQRKQAAVLNRTLQLVRKMWEEGESDPAKLVAAGREEMTREKMVRLDYFEIVNAHTLDRDQSARKGDLVAVAAFVGTTRLIDNVVLGEAGTEK